MLLLTGRTDAQTPHETVARRRLALLILTEAVVVLPRLAVHLLLAVDEHTDNVVVIAGDERRLEPDRVPLVAAYCGDPLAVERGVGEEHADAVVPINEADIAH